MLYSYIGSRLVTAAITSVQLRPMQFGGCLIELAVLLLVLAVVAAVLGSSGIAGLSWSIAKWLVIIFVLLAVISAVL